jgi:Phosphatidylinositol-specific phospholipase C, Y domain
MRVYPGLTRVTSNNFDPIVFWKKGVQMVALNWQKYGTEPYPTFSNWQMWECKFMKLCFREIINMDIS